MSPADSCVLYHVPARGLSRRRLREFARQLQALVAEGRAFCCLVTGDTELRRLNKLFRKKDSATDVLAFPSESAGETAYAAKRLAFPLEGASETTYATELLGELAISWDRVKAQAAEYGHTTDDEIRILMLHGVLHLTGMDHEKDGGKMARAERRWRKRLNLPAGLTERVRP